MTSFTGYEWGHTYEFHRDGTLMRAVVHLHDGCFDMLMATHIQGDKSLSDKIIKELTQRFRGRPIEEFEKAADARKVK